LKDNNMKKNDKKDTGYVEKRKFVLDPDFKDPLLILKANAEEAFDEIEVEEIPYFYNVFLGSEFLNKKKKHDNS